MTTLILASGSPRRRELLGALGVAFEVIKPDVDETPNAGEDALQTQARITRDKALAVAARAGRAARILACDTCVILDGVMLNKPVNDSEAWGMLTALRGRAHSVNTCMVLLDPAHAPLTLHDAAEVVMRNYGDAELEAYIKSGDPADKAGAYAIQHPFAPVAQMHGCPLTVIGLSLCALHRARPDVFPPAHTLCTRVAGELGMQACAAG
jgi:septum formation protein